MKQLFKTVFGILHCILLVSSCSMIDFSEDCFYTGDVEVTFDWQYLLKGDDKPNLMQTIFYPDNSSLSSYILTGDTLLTGLAATRNEVLSFNHPQGVSFYETDCHCTAYAALDTYQQDGKLYVINAPSLYAAKNNIQVEAFGTTRCELIPKPCFQQVFIDFVIIRNNVEAQVETLSGELSGVVTSYSFGEMAAMKKGAVLAFDGKQSKEDKYDTALQVLGMTGNEIPQILNLSLSLTDGKQHTHGLDLTSTFKDFTTPAIYLTIEIRLSNLGISLSIADWYTGEGGNIDL